MSAQLDTAIRLAAKIIADERQHGCHYAEGTCRECADLADVAGRSVVRHLAAHPTEEQIEAMAYAAWESGGVHAIPWDELSEETHEDYRIMARADHHAYWASVLGEPDDRS